MSNSSIPGIKVADSKETDQLSTAKLLQNVEESYDKRKFLLEESCINLPFINLQMLLIGNIV